MNTQPSHLTLASLTAGACLLAAGCASSSGHQHGATPGHGGHGKACCATAGCDSKKACCATDTTATCCDKESDCCKKG